MSRSSIRYVDTTYMYGQQVNANPMSNPVIYGHFPKRNIDKNTSCEKLNKVLSCLLFGLVLVSLVSYYFVSDGEKTMNSLGREIVALTNENIELQNKLDNLYSFNKVDTVIQDKTVLDTAKQVIEIPVVGKVSAPKVKPAPVNYNWTIGY